MQNKILATLLAALGLKAPPHTHEKAYNGLDHNHRGLADAAHGHDSTYARLNGHMHSNYLVGEELEERLRNILPDYARLEHQHDDGLITGYSKTGHEHRALAAKIADHAAADTHSLPPDHSHPHEHDHDGNEHSLFYAPRLHEHDTDGAAAARSVIVPVEMYACQGGKPVDSDDVLKLRRSMGQVETFFRAVGIDLRVTYRSQNNVDGVGFEPGESEFFLRGYHGGAVLTGYVDVSAKVINPKEKGWVGQIAYKTGPWGAFIIAGGNDENYVAKTVMHELGHYLLRAPSRDHQAETFMSSAIGAYEVVTPHQKASMLETAREEWGY